MGICFAFFCDRGFPRLVEAVLGLGREGVGLEERRRSQASGLVK